MSSVVLGWRNGDGRAVVVAVKRERKVCDSVCIMSGVSGQMKLVMDGMFTEYGGDAEVKSAESRA